MSPRFFIDRPIFASVISIVIVGLLAMKALPIAQFPEITPPVVQIDADYPGASAEIVADAVARPIEVQLSGIDRLLYFDSTSTNDGHMTIKLTFEIGTNIDIAQVQAQNRVKLAEPQIPQEVARQGVTVKKVSPDLLAVVALSSDDPRYDTLFLSNFATLQVLDKLRRVPGIGDANVFGQQNYSMRLILDPVRLAQLKLTPTDIAAVVRDQNRDFPAGIIGREPALKGTELTFPVITQGRLTEVKEFEELIVRALPDGASKQRTDAVLGKLERYYTANPNIDFTNVFSGQNFVFSTRGPNTATIFLPLKHWDERKKPEQQANGLIGASFKEFAKIPEATILAFNPPPAPTTSPTSMSAPRTGRARR